VIPPDAAYFPRRGLSVCLSFVHILAFCLNCSTDLDAVANGCCHLANGNEKRFRFSATLLWCLFNYAYSQQESFVRLYYMAHMFTSAYKVCFCWRYGNHYWLLDVNMDCASTDAGWFELKAYVTSDVSGTAEWWESDVTQATQCSGSVGGHRPYASTNHVARCGYINVFQYEQETCAIHSFWSNTACSLVDTPGRVRPETTKNARLENTFTSDVARGENYGSPLLQLLVNKKFELMLTRRAKAHSSSCSQIVLVYLQSFRCNLLLKLLILGAHGLSKSLLLIQLKSSSPVLVTIGCMSVPICNRLHARLDNSGKITSFKGDRTLTTRAQVPLNLEGPDLDR